MKKRGRNIRGVIYLLHFTEPLEHAKHYIGWTHSYASLESRLEYHERGQGSRLIRAVMQSGGNFQIARLWYGTRFDERRLKKRAYASRICPVCAGEHACVVKGLEQIAL